MNIDEGNGYVLPEKLQLSLMLQACFQDFVHIKCS